MYSPGGMPSGPTAFLNLSSSGTFGYSFLCHGVAMWISALTMNTNTDDARIGNHNEAIEVMTLSFRAFARRLVCEAAS
jgi:hypothetical protein